jgi:hypothetical protein
MAQIAVNGEFKQSIVFSHKLMLVREAFIDTLLTDAKFEQAIEFDESGEPSRFEGFTDT